MKKGILKNVFLGIMIAVMLIFGMEIFKEFMANHTYYNDMFSSGTNWGILVGAVISALIPIIYLSFTNKKFSLGKFTLFTFIGALFFGFISLIIKKAFIGTGAILYIINELILFVLGGYFLVATLAFGTWISKLLFKFKENRIQELFLNFGIGLGGLLLIWQTLIGFGLFHPVVNRITFLGLGFFIRYEKDSMKEYKELVSQSITSINKNSNNNRWKYILIVLLVCSLAYYFYGFQLSFIPYSTAWDANHEYMYVTKVIAENNGLIRGNMGVANSMPYIWHTFISFWFSIGSIFSGNRLSPDTIAVAMNFLSGPLCLIFGLLLIKEVLDYFIPRKDDEDCAIRGISFGTGWATLLLWLCSGMGAFLIFVDNKTDLGVMALTLLAMLSGFVFIRYIAEHKDDKSIKGFDKESMKYLIVSGVFFTLACMSKPTAFIDVAVFGVLLCALWLNSFVGLGVGIMGLGFMGILKPLSAAQFMTESLGKWLILIGLIISIFGLLMMFTREKKKLTKNKSLFSYLVVWAVSFVCSLIIFKGPWLAYKQITITDDFSIGNRGKNLIMSFNNEEGKINKEEGKKILLATTEEYLDLESQNKVDREYLMSEEYENVEITEDLNDDISIEQCLSTKYSDNELKEGLKKAPVGNEDFGRYVGYGWKEFKNTKRLSYKILRLFYPKDGKCYGVNSDAKILCENQSAIEKGDIDVIKNLKLSQGSPAYEILESGLIAYNENPDTLSDLILNLKTYYQDHVIYTKNGKMNIPYRYVVPLNIVFNRSLQNLSSYYTDIGFVWMFLFIFLILSFIYSIIKKDRKLFAISMATEIGWAIWRVIGSAILWYGVGLLMWTALTMAAYIQDILSGDDEEGVDVFGIITISLLGLIIIIQFFFNFIRIASQGSSGPFLWFKQSVGTEQVVSNNLSVQTNTKIGYSQKDVFDLQFPQYNQFIEYVKDRKDEDGVLIAGTYIQYFLDNQKNIKDDGSLSRFWEQGSDGDVCKMYQRLKNSNIKYLVIDPNIASIVMGDGNKSLFYRFFAKTNDNGKIIEKGSLMMLSELIDKGYAKLLYSNNVGATYGFTLTDEELQTVFGEMNKEELIYLRAQLSASRYMSNATTLINGIASIFYNRFAVGDAITDIAGILGRQIEFGKVLNAVNVYIQAPQSLPQIVATLSQDERVVLIQFINMYKSNSSQFEEYMSNLIYNSIAGGGQLIVVELL